VSPGVLKVAKGVPSRNERDASVLDMAV
jgi:hypothetical protein